jgi:hypothetical protein
MYPTNVLLLEASYIPLFAVQFCLIIFPWGCENKRSKCNSTSGGTMFPTNGSLYIGMATAGKPTRLMVCSWRW